MSTQMERKLILASASPRRKMLLENLGLKFDVIPANIDESEYKHLIPSEAVKVLALKKAEKIAQTIDYPALVLGSDTTVVIHNMSLGKPKDDEDAFKTLKLLSGKINEVLTGIAIIDTSNNKQLIESVHSAVKFRDLSDEEIIKYIQTKEPADKAGSYAIQGIAGIFVESMSGCYSNIVGLPVFKIAQMLEKFGVNILDLNIAND